MLQIFEMTDCWDCIHLEKRRGGFQYCLLNGGRINVDLGNVSAKDRDKELLSINSGYDELRTVYNELKKIFDSGIRSTESFESAKDYNHIYAPGTK